MSQILHYMKHGKFVEFERCFDGCLWYRIHVNASHPPDLICDWEDFAFRIPLEDTPGATFPARDENVRYYMRWIRKDLLELEQLVTKIAETQED